MGTIGTVLQLFKLPDGTVKVLVEGGERALHEVLVERPVVKSKQHDADDPRPRQKIVVGGLDQPCLRVL